MVVAALHLYAPLSSAMTSTLTAVDDVSGGIDHTHPASSQSPGISAVVVVAPQTFIPPTREPTESSCADGADPCCTPRRASW